MAWGGGGGQSSEPGMEGLRGVRRKQKGQEWKEFQGGGVVNGVRVTENMEMKETAGMSPWGAPESNGNGLSVSRGDKPGWGAAG